MAGVKKAPPVSSLLVAVVTITVVLLFICEQAQGSAVAFISPHSKCNTSCDGSLAYPFPTIKRALDYLARLLRVTYIVLLPGVYKGPENTGLTPVAAGFTIHIIGSGQHKTIIDCEGIHSGFNFSGIFVSMIDVTVRNCRGSAASLLLAELILQRTSWINNTAEYGGAIYLPRGESLFNGGNSFINNTATIAGGAVATNLGRVLLHGDEVLQGNVAHGLPASANYYTSNKVEEGVPLLTSLRFPASGTAPPLTLGPTIANPVKYVNASVDCSPGKPPCDGSVDRPFNNLKAVTWPAWIGGIIYVAPGKYVGPQNTELFWARAHTLIARWPDTDGKVIIDCKGRSYGLVATLMIMEISEITFRHCVTTEKSFGGGGAIQANYSKLVLTDVHFVGNSATNQLSGGAVHVESVELLVSGGSFVNNSAPTQGGAVYMKNTVSRFDRRAAFRGNRLTGAVMQDKINDVTCTSSELQDDGSVPLQLKNSEDCFLSVASPSTTAVFLGALNGLLYPKTSLGAFENTLFAGLQFASVVEIDSTTGLPINETRLTKSGISWIVDVTKTSDYIQLEYDAFATKRKTFIKVIHTFFFANSTFQPLGEGVPPVQAIEGTLKSSVQVAFWNFRSKSNSLAVNLRIRASDPLVGGVSESLNSVGDKEYVFQTTNQLRVTYSASPTAVYDDVSNVKKDVEVRAHPFDTGVTFTFKFSHFDTWVTYDPQFGVALVTTSESGDGGGTDVPYGVIVGVSVGVPLFLCIVAVMASAVVAALFWMRSRYDSVGAVNFNSTDTYSLMKDETEPI